MQTRWKTLRDCYKKLVDPLKSGSSPNKPLTERNKYIIWKLAFTRGTGDQREEVVSNLDPASQQANGNERHVAANSQSGVCTDEYATTLLGRENLNKFNRR